MKRILTFCLFTALSFTINNTLHAQGTTNKSSNISSLITKKRQYNKQDNSGFRIQLYYGSEKRAKSYLGSFRSKFPGTSTKLTYNPPYWKVKVGSYKTRLEADRALNKIREKFSGAIIIKK